MGGTFNPIHIGHLILAQETMAARGLDQVLFVPNRVPPHKQDDASLAGDGHRWVMTCLATASNDRFIPSRIELDRESVSYSVDTVRALAEPSRSLTFISGADALMRYAWKDLDVLLGMVEAFVICERPGFDAAALQERLDGLGLANRGRIVPQEIPSVDVSSSLIRERRARGGNIRYLVPEVVEQYIQKHGLYRT